MVYARACVSYLDSTFGLWNDGIVINIAMQYAYMLFTCLQHLNQMTLFPRYAGYIPVFLMRHSNMYGLLIVHTGKEPYSFRYLCVTNLKPLTNQIIH